MKPDELRTLTDVLLEQLPIGVILTDTEGNITLVNKTAERIRHILRDNVVGHNVLDCHTERSKASVTRAVENIMRKPDTVYRRMVDDTRNDRFYINTYAGLMNDEGVAIGMAVLSEDITDKRRLELERATNYQMMEENNAAIRQKYHELMLASLESVMRILEARDRYTCDHSHNVCAYALKMYEYRYGVGNDYHNLRNAASLHDIGKVGIPDEILHKSDRLTAEEFTIIKRHSEMAEAILKPIDSGNAISKIVRHHHERYDGNGYPDGLSGDDIPLASRIIAIADAYEAMSSDRPYRKALSYEQCLAEVSSHAGSQFDPEWSQVLLELASTGSL